MLLKSLDTGQGFLKAGFLGFAGSGKTYTASLLAVAVREMFDIDAKKPVAMFDTEGGSQYIAPVLKELCGADMVGVRSQSFDALMQMARDVEADDIPVLLVDSMTHIWRDVTDSYLRQVNEQLKMKGLRPRKRLSFPDWGPIKEKFKTWTDWYLNSSVHVIICGRAGYEYDFERDEETGKRELIKTGTKMKTETEFGFEPSLLVEMGRERVGKEIARTALVLKDRFGKIDGEEARFGGAGGYKDHLEAAKEFFSGHLSMLKPGASAPVDTTSGSRFDVDATGEIDASRRKRKLEVVLDEIKEEMQAIHAGMSAASKTGRADLAEEVFGTRSWEKITTYQLEDLKAGLEKIRTMRKGDEDNG